MLLHPETSLIGKNLYTLQDEKGNYIFQNLIK
jgi:signal transduction histidine kinase